MKLRREVGTHIAMLGVWDPDQDAHPIGPEQNYEKLLKLDAQHGRVFFIGTGVGAGGPVDFYIDEEPPEQLLRDYEKVPRRFRINCTSGKLLAGGMEDYRSVSEVKLTSEEDCFELPAGIYSLALHVLLGRAEKLAFDETHLIEAIGAEDYAYWQKKKPGSGLGCLFLLIVGSLAFFKWWIPALLALCAGMITLALRQRQRRENARYQEIDKRVTAFRDQFPEYIFELQATTESRAPEGGWHELV